MKNFLDTVRYFNGFEDGTVQNFARTLLKPENQSSEEGDKLIDKIFSMLGAWLAMESYFRKYLRGRPIEGMSSRGQVVFAAKDCPLNELLRRCPLVPCGNYSVPGTTKASDSIINGLTQLNNATAYFITTNMNKNNILNNLH